MRVALVCSAHGFGHVTRERVIADALAARGADVTLFTAAPPAIVGAGVRHVPWVVDVGIAQRDGLHEDLDETRARLDTVVNEARIDALAEVLAAYDRVVVDIAPPALEAARRAGVPAFAVGNFDWAWIYRHYPPLHDWAERFAAWQAPHPALFLAPGPGLFGFRSVEAFGVVGRVARPNGGGGALRGAPYDPLPDGAGRGFRPASGVPPPQDPHAEKHVLVCFGGFGLDGVAGWLPNLTRVTWTLAPPMPRVERADVCYVDDVPFPALVATADALLTKPGYGIHAEAALAGTPIVWVDRGGFPEAPHLEAAMRARGDVKIEGRGPGLPDSHAIAAALAAVWSRPRPEALASDAPDRVADRILAHDW